MNNGYLRLLLPVGASLLALQLAACGGGSSSSGDTTPEEPTYSIGGTVTGLENSGLVLENNGTDSLEVAGVSFEFDTQLEDGSTYAVTVAQPPEHQLCSVDNASGTVAGADVEVRCRYWRSAELIETDDNGNADAPQIAFDGSGNTIAVWDQDDGTRTNIRANRFE